MVIIIGIFGVSCGNSSKTVERQEEQVRMDTLWSLIGKVKKLYTYDMEEIAIRKKEMDSVLNILKFAKPNELKEGEKGEISAFYAIRRAYGPIADQYKSLVLGTEDVFYRVKAFEKSMKNGDYDNKKDDFKKEYIELKTILNNQFTEATQKLEKLTALEPAYQRLAPKIDEYAERVYKQ